MASSIGTFPACVYIFSSFIANVGMSVTGFGMALIFVFVYTLFDVFGWMADCDPMNLCGLKYAVFIQSLSLAGSVPFLIYKSNAREYANKLLLSTLIPVTLVSTPAGQLLQGYVASSWIRIILGVIVAVVVCWKIFESYRVRKKVVPIAAITTRGDETPSERSLLLMDNDDDNHNHNHNENSTNIDTNLVFWGIVLGFLSGFLGGLIGMRGPPLIIFFLNFPFPKTEARAVGAILLFFNMVLRILFYAIEDIYNSNASSTTWFSWQDNWHVYVGVVFAGILGVPIGDYVHHHIDQEKFRKVLAILLAASGIVNIAKGCADMKQKNGASNNGR